MSRSLQDANRAALLLVAAANVVTFCLAVRTGTVLGGEWLGAVRRLPEILPAGLCLVLVGVANAQLSADAKARIVFLRWRDPLPGAEAFTRHALADPRVDLLVLERDNGPLPTDPRQQNLLWYRLYQTVSDHPAVSRAHREYLFMQDYACLSFLIMIGFGTAGLFQFPSRSTALGYIGLLALQYLLVRRAGRNHGIEFVTTVLALKGAGR